MVFMPVIFGASSTARVRIAETRAPIPQWSSRPLPHGRARHARPSTIGYSHTALKITGARKALNAPPITPPSDIDR